MKSHVPSMCAEINERIAHEEEQMAKVRDAQEIERTIWVEKSIAFEVRIRDTRQQLTRLQTAVTVLQEFYD